MEPLLQLIGRLSSIVKPQAQAFIKDQGLSEIDAYARAFGALLFGLAEIELLERDFDVMIALHARYDRHKKPVARADIINDLKEKANCDESTIYRSLKRLRGVGFIRLVGTKWEPLVDPRALGILPDPASAPNNITPIRKSKRRWKKAPGGLAAAAA